MAVDRMDRALRIANIGVITEALFDKATAAGNVEKARRLGQRLVKIDHAIFIEGLGDPRR
ncbi:hypothetical protein PMI02_01623 [Novosphingobium sp. AP12]|nr:hypothetical protein PMI02_01623 [Novosphingobium sp. AP12]